VRSIWNVGCDQIPAEFWTLVLREGASRKRLDGFRGKLNVRQLCRYSALVDDKSADFVTLDFERAGSSFRDRNSKCRIYL